MVSFRVANTCNTGMSNISFNFLGIDENSQTTDNAPLQQTSSMHSFEFTPQQLNAITDVQISLVAGTRGASVMFDMVDCGIKPIVPFAACTNNFGSDFTIGFIDSVSVQGQTQVRFSVANQSAANVSQVTFELPVEAASATVPTNAAGNYEGRLNYTVAAEGNVLTFTPLAQTATYGNNEADFFTFTIPTETFRLDPYFLISLQAQQQTGDNDFFVAGFNVRTCDDQPITPLPVELLSFEGKAAQSGIALEWSTASEENNQGFTVERSSDGRNFAQIGTVAGAGNSSTKLNYRYTDTAPKEGINYYRLKQTDYNGKFEYSKTVAVTYTSPYVNKAIEVYPNPATQGVVRVAMHNPDGAVLQIMDMNGRQVYLQELQAGQQEIELTVSELKIPKGLYYVNLQRPNGRETQKLIIR